MNGFHSSHHHQKKEGEREEEQDLHQDTQSLSEETSRIACLAIAPADNTGKENEDYRKRPLDGSPKAKQSALPGSSEANMYAGLTEQQHRHQQQPAPNSLLTSHLRPSQLPAEEASRPNLPVSSLSEHLKPLSASPAPNVDSDTPRFDVFDTLADYHERDVVDRTNSWAKAIPYGKPPPLIAAAPSIEQAGQHLEGIGFGESPGDARCLQNFVAEKRTSTSPRNAGVPIADAAGRNGHSGFNRVSFTSSPSGTGASIPQSHSSSYGSPYANLLGASPSSRFLMSGPAVMSPVVPERDSKRCSIGANAHHPSPLMPQTQFYGPSDVDLANGAQGHMASGYLDRPYTFCSFDTIQCPPRSSKLGGKVLLVGRDGCLEVLGLDADKPRVVGRIAGLNGRVVDAKLLSWSSHSDPFASSRPLVAIILHGQVSVAEGDGLNHDPSDNMSGISPGIDVPYVQTSVQVYSLRTQQLITTLYHTKPVPCYHGVPGHPVTVPGPIGHLHLHVSGNYLLVSSGASGEVFIFTAKFLETSFGPTFQCLGKCWASTQTQQVDSRRHSHSSSSNLADIDDGSDSDKTRQTEVPLLSLSGRYLAVVSPSLSNKVSIQGVVPQALIARGACGMNMYTPSARPSVTCATDEGQDESLLNKVARGLTQEFFRGAKWIGDQGLQTWHSYWNKVSDDVDSGANSHSKPSGQYARKSYAAEVQGLGAGYLPPTHAQDAVPHEPEVISIFDLKRLDEETETRTSASLSQTAVFHPPNGCSFLSLAPNGLYLLTSNKKGDVQHVWELMQIKHRRTKAFLSDEGHPTPIVRQVGRYARMTTSKIVDAIWTMPNCDRFAVVTQKGTVHVHALPHTAFQWPPPRRLTPPSKPILSAASKEQFSEENGSSNGPANPLSTAWKYVGHRTQPLLAATNFRKPSVPNLSGASALEVSAAAGLRGKKAVAAGFSKSVGAATGTVSTIRHSRDNKLHLPTFSHDALPGRIAWLDTPSGLALGVIDTSVFNAYTIQRSSHPTNNRGSNGRPWTVVGSKLVDMKLPSIVQASSHLEPLFLATPPRETGGFWTLPTMTASYQAQGSKSWSQPLSQAELDSNSPYLPFHTDRRVSVRIYSSSHGGENPDEPWAFGAPIPSLRLNVCSPASDEENQDDDQVAHMVNHVSAEGAVGDKKQVVITTRRKKRNNIQASQLTARGLTEEDGFFEDDCEVLDFAEDRV
ncbi:hypothetical protein KEM56_006237 [Ascosphaera pollenicola]|nr:hypothetical protein KEM56_006237 [Ascosphaera pollenicola]